MVATGFGKDAFPTKYLVSRFKRIVESEGGIQVFQWLIKNLKIPKWLVPPKFHHLHVAAGMSSIQISPSDLKKHSESTISIIF